MITCTFEDGGKGELRHVVTHILIVKDSKILLVKRAPGILEAGKWGFPGGFLSQGENIATGALRELMEETGYEGTVDALFRINSNPNRTNDQGRNNVVFEFLVTAGERTGEPDWEQTEVEWRDINDLAADEMAFDHYLTIEALRKYIIEKFPLPLIV
jgi:ADP-ribose pyrophosphatase YjhB (NUDIX family)